MTLAALGDAAFCLLGVAAIIWMLAAVDTMLRRFDQDGEP